MSRCSCCDSVLNDAELTAKIGGEYTNTCRTCLKESGLLSKVKWRPDLLPNKPKEVNQEVSDTTEWERLHQMGFYDDTWDAS